MKLVLLVLLAVLGVGHVHAKQTKARPSLGSRIKHIIVSNCASSPAPTTATYMFISPFLATLQVLMEENRSFDHFLGYAKKLLGVNGLDGT